MLEIHTPPCGGCFLNLPQGVCGIQMELPNDMFPKWSIIVKSTSEPKPRRKAYHVKDKVILCDF